MVEIVTLIPGCLGEAMDEGSGLVTGVVAGAIARYGVVDIGETVVSPMVIGWKRGVGRIPGELLVDL